MTSFDPNKNLPDWLEAGTLIDDRYEITGVLGRGGVAVVYRAIQRDIQREVALKVVSSEISPQLRRRSEKRLINEGLTTARIHHPNVINIRSMGRSMRVRRGAELIDYPHPYMVMESLQGHSLAEQLVQEGPMPPARALPLFLEVLDALAVAHELGIVHKDIKPDNLYLTHPGLTREALIVLDFGIARSGAAFTSDGAMPCTVNYVAPEYIEHQIVTPAIDVYQSALALIELLTGKLVVNSDYVTQCIAAHINGRLDIPAVILNSALWPVLKQALHRDYEARLPNARVFHDLLRTIPAHTIDFGEEVAEELLFGDEGERRDERPVTATIPDVRSP